MEIITTTWIVIFFLFALTLLYVWSKTLIISKKAKAIEELLVRIENIGTSSAAETK